MKPGTRWFSRGGLLILLAGLALLPACKPKPPPESGINATDPQWVYQAPTKPKTAVVFVHGIFGDTLGTWTNANGGTFFDYLRDAPGMKDQFDIFAFGFTSNMFEGGSLDIREAANVLDQKLMLAKVWDYDQVVFVAHSMGGLVVLEELSDQRQRLEQVPLVVLYSTPQDGADIASIASHLADNPALAQMYPSNGSEFLKALDDNWGKIPPADRPIVKCAYEKKPTHGVQIVGQASATRFCNDAKIAIGGADHISIVKPDRAQHPSVDVLLAALQQYVLGEANHPAFLEMPDFVPEGDVLVYSMHDLISPSARLVNNGPRKLRFALSQPSDPKLLVSPEDTPRFVAAGQQQELKFHLLMRGALLPEYRFVISSDTAPDRTVVVRVDDVAAVQEHQQADVQALVLQLSQRLGDQVVLEKLGRLTPDEQLRDFSDFTRQAVMRRNPGVSASIASLLTADTLLAAGWPELATRALRDVERDSPAALALPSVQLLAGVASAQSGDARVFVSHPTPTPAATDLAAGSMAARITADDASTWSLLSERMLGVPALKRSGLILQGDVLQQQGKHEAAGVSYHDASLIRSSPLLEYKLSGTRAPRPEASNGLDTLSPDGVGFDFRSPALRPETRAALDAAALELKNHPSMTLDVVGYADPAEGSDAESLALSARRANAVSAYLVNQGVDASRIDTRGAGERAPIAAGTAPAERTPAERRRVEITAEH